MLNAELAFRAQDIALDVRSFSVEEALSQPFEVLVTARSRSSDLDLDGIVGYGAALRLAARAELSADRKPYRVWSGVCSHAEQVRVEPDGVSTYCLRIMPMFWRTTQRRSHRVFQHVTVPELVTSLLGEYGIEPELRLDPSAFPRHEYRVQYGETDFAFISRLLEEAGVSYSFEQVAPAGEGELDLMKVVLADRPGDARARKGDPVPYIGDTEQWPDGPFISNVRFSRQLRPGRVTIRDYDFRSSPDLRLLASVRAKVASEERYELYHYMPGAFLSEPGRGRRHDGAKVDEQLGQARADLALDSVRTGRRTLSFRSNVADLHPGTVFRMGEYPRREISEKTDLLLVRRTIEGDVEELTDMHAEATLADEPYRPALQTPKPRMSGIQSAIVVGPEGEEIYTDEYGRVRVQFHWDREGKHDENSSCWIRVTQAWAGSGWGITSIPRVGTEVVVDFFEGDPDKPVIIGCVHNSACRTPYALPEHKTKTAWKSSSSPGAGGSNEITFDDARGEEKIYVHAQKDWEQRVEANETRTTGANLSAIVVQNEQREVQGDQNIVVKGDRNVDNDGCSAQRAQQGMAIGSGASTGMACQQGAVTVTNGQTSLMLDGPNVYIDCSANLRICAGRTLTLSGKQVRIIGDPEVFINCHDAVRPNVRTMPGFWLAGAADEARQRDRTGRTRGRGRAGAEDPGDLDEASFERARRGRRDDMPDRVRVPRAVDEQLRGQARSTRRGSRTGRLLDALSYASMKRNLDRRLRYEQKRLEDLDRDLHNLVAGEDGEGLVASVSERLKEERENLANFFDDIGDVFQGEHGGFVDSCGALYDAFRVQIGNIVALRSDLLYFIDDCKALGQSVSDIWDDWKTIIEDPGDALLDILFGDQADEVGALIEGAVGGGAEAASGAAGAAAEAAGRAPRAPGGLGESAGRPPGGRRPDHPARQHVARQPGGGSNLKEAIRNRGLQSSQSGGKSMGDMARDGGLRRSQAGSRSLPEAARRHRAAAQQMSGQSPLQQPDARDAVRGRGMSSSSPTTQSMQDAVRGHGMVSSQSDMHQAAPKPLSGSSPLGPDGVQGAAQARGMTSAGQGGGSIADAAGARGMSSSASTGGIDGAGSLQHTAGDAGMTAAQGGGEPIGTAGRSFSRSGGLAASDVANNVAPDDVTFLQSPSDGQLMVVPTEGATAVDQTAISSAMINAQMTGQPVKPAVTESLSGSGYVVYERSWGDWFGEFVRAGQSQTG